MFHRFRLVVAGVAVTLALVGSVACSDGSDAGEDTGIEPLVGQWRGVLLSPGGELPFYFRVNPQGSDPPAVVINAGAERPLLSVARQGAASYTLTFFNDRDSQIVAEMSPDGEELHGFWSKTNEPPPPGSSSNAVTQMPFSATKTDQRRFQRNDPTLDIVSADGIAAVPNVDGEWEGMLAWGPSDRAFSGVMLQSEERVTTEIITGPPGLEGSYRDGLLRLSMFDGSRALLLHARATPAGALEGTMWMTDQRVSRWSARRR